ncbi:MAG: class I SAM-dependent methyltransferase [SAR202 cluster bacterium]|jgi:ubiquinone/menaquinone biosynthesis C-methylase UbiE|nr:class I SAM-dependent methyltransferase [SAR202 cluster bacterium]MDP6713192.1 class I SAM-dependent methyltransferase [SAR202 cluster bacterium]
MTTAAYDEIADWYDRIRSSEWNPSDKEGSLLELIGDVSGQYVCDLACGQGIISRLLTERGAQVVGVDISEKMLDIARRYESENSLGVTYIQDNAHELSNIPDESFDGVVCVWALMDIPDAEATLANVARVLRTGGWFVMCITHPCFCSPDSGDAVDGNGVAVREVRHYFDEGFWVSDTSNPKSVRAKVGAHHRTLSAYLNAIIDAGLLLERVVEPRGIDPVTGPVLRSRPTPLAFMVRCRKA